MENENVKIAEMVSKYLGKRYYVTQNESVAEYEAVSRATITNDDGTLNEECMLLMLENVHVGGVEKSFPFQIAITAENLKMNEDGRGILILVKEYIGECDPTRKLKIAFGLKGTIKLNIETLFGAVTDIMDKEEKKHETSQNDAKIERS